jgi:hypothetical protein
MRRAVPALVALLVVVVVPSALPAHAAPVPSTGCQVLPSDNIWNTDISNLPVDPYSAQWMSSMNAATNNLHPDFGGPPYGFPFNVVDNTHPTVNVSFQYASESDAGPYPVGSDTLIENGSDHHALIINKDTCTLYELFHLAENGSSWTAGSGAIFPLGSDALRPADWTSADAAGLHIFPGLVRWDEVQAGAITHAIRFTAVQTDQSYLWPARHQAGVAADTSLPPMGARFRLKSSYDISRFSAQAQVILRAMQHYGLILADNGSNWYFSGTEDASWPDSLLSELKTVPASQFEAIDESSLEASANSAAVVTGCGTATASSGPGPSSGANTFYFAEGFTGPGFIECLSLFTPKASGLARIDYYLNGGGQQTQFVSLQSGQVATINVNQAVGPDREVSARVTLPGPGIAERTLHFNANGWYGSSDIVGATQQSSEWDFAEGSTLGFFTEYLTLENPNSTSVPATLTYMTDGGAHPSKTVMLAPSSRTTIEVFKGDAVSNLSSCTPNGAGSDCGVGPGIAGVSTRVTTPSGQPIVAERPFYVNGFSFGSGAIRGGHVAFGANAPATHWYFAEGTTLPGFNEYLTLQNPGAALATANIRYLDSNGSVTTRVVSINPLSRLTIEVFKTSAGVGPGAVGVSTAITSDQPIVAERPMYMVHDFGSGPVASAHDGMGQTALGTLFGFAAASTVAGENDYLTVENPNATAANVVLSYYAGGAPLTRTIVVSPNTRHTVAIFGAAEGIGSGTITSGVTVSSDQPILVEKPTYSSSPATYGATDTGGYAPSSF